MRQPCHIQVVTRFVTILFEIITFQIRKPLNHVTVIEEILKNTLLDYFPQLHSTIKNKETVTVMLINSEDAWKL